MSTEDGDDYTGTIRAWRAAPDLMPDPEPWSEEAACRGKTDLFFPTKATHRPTAYDAARRICAGCPVRSECLDYALTQGSWHVTDLGMWGGTTPRERRNIRKAWKTAS